MNKFTLVSPLFKQSRIAFTLNNVLAAPVARDKCADSGHYLELCTPTVRVQYKTASRIKRAAG